MKVSVKPARVKESAVNIECEACATKKPPVEQLTYTLGQLYRSIDFASESNGPPTTTLLIGLIKHIHIRNAVLTEDQKTVDPSKLRPVARLEGNTFVRLGEAFDVARPSWKALKDSVEEMIEERK